MQKVLTDTSNITIKNLYDEDRELFINIFESLDSENYKAIRGESKLGRYKTSKTIFSKNNLKGRRYEKTIIPSNIIDIDSKLEILLELRLSSHTDTLTEASNLIDELYKTGEVQNEQQYRSAIDKFHTFM